MGERGEGGGGDGIGGSTKATDGPMQGRHCHDGSGCYRIADRRSDSVEKTN